MLGQDVLAGDASSNLRNFCSMFRTEMKISSCQMGETVRGMVLERYVFPSGLPSLPTTSTYPPRWGGRRGRRRRRRKEPQWVGLGGAEVARPGVRGLGFGSGPPATGAACTLSTAADMSDT